MTTPPLPIRLGDANDFVELRLLERGPEATPAQGDLRLNVAVRSHGFTGEYDHIWIARDDWRAFLHSLRRLERERTGAASLESLSPDEFKLALQVVDRAGHLVAHGCLSRYHFGPSGQTGRSRIEYHLSVDPSTLRELVESFDAFAAPDAMP